MNWTISQTDDLATCLALRRTVIMEEQGVRLADEIDGVDDEALHMLALLDATPVGCARILISGEAAKIGRACVLKAARGKGLGAAIITACLDIARQQSGLARAQLGAQIHAVPFYEKLGFAAFGPVYDDAGLPHRDMECAL